MKRLLALFLAALCSISLFISPVSATGVETDVISIKTSRIDLPDGGYIIEEVTQTPSFARTTYSTSGAKTSTRYTASVHAVFAVKVNGSFKYTGSSSWATSASATVSIYDSNASYVSKSASYSSNYATATGNVTYLGTSISRTATLYCDKNGNLS